MLSANFCKARFRSFLRRLGLLPFAQPRWHQVSVTHPARVQTKDQIKAMRRFLKQNLPTSGGVYLYLNSTNKLVYVGKAKNLSDRAYSHYLETFKKVRGDKAGVWHRFFSRNAGRLKLLWMSIDGDRERYVIEQMIESVVQSKFDRQFPKGHRFLKGTD
jgi:hypothetical protein